MGKRGRRLDAGEAMKRGRTYDWIPLWRQKWLMGSTRFELEPGERSVFLDFLCLAGNDDGFIRANPETPYPNAYLANTLRVPIELLERTIQKCQAVGKLCHDEHDCLYICNWNEYQLTERHKRRLMDVDRPQPGSSSEDEDGKSKTETETERGSKNPDTTSASPDINKEFPRGSDEKPEGLLPIPKGISLKLKDQLVEERAEIRRRQRLLDAGRTQDGPDRLTQEILEKQKARFNQAIRDLEE